MDLLSLVLTLRPTERGALPPRLGRAAHAILLARIAAMDEALAAALHDDEGPKPITASDLMGGRVGDLQATPEATYTLRYTALTAPTAAALAQAFVLGDVLTFEGLRFEVEGIDPAGIDAAPGSPWAGWDDYADLAARHLRPSGAPPPTSWSLLFASPIAFKSQGATQPLPLPGLVFGSLAMRWNAFAPVALPEDELRRYAEQMVAIGRFSLRSAPGWDRGPGLRIGSIGHATYRALNRDRYWCAALGLLAEFARYAGVGILTAAGMGQTRQMPDQDER